jgi:hypothetical protein
MFDQKLATRSLLAYLVVAGGAGLAGRRGFRVAEELSAVCQESRMTSTD